METYRIPVDLITCDPNHYVRCARMVEAVETLPADVQGLLEVHEWSIRTPQGRNARAAFHAQTIPTMCVNGQKCFENHVPDIDELFTALLHAARTEEQRLTLIEAWGKANEEYAPDLPVLPRAMRHAA
jgi:hypothetical protein